MFTGEAVATLAGAIVGPAIAQALSMTWAACAAGTLTLLSGVAAVLLLPRNAPRLDQQSEADSQAAS
ncbi:hypothetical protein [Planosporangium mesophilum]|uniref:MFS transporter n=1 Tax=Planosporangium mesophilum TaxID=689768 RepID=A0A8J3TFR4_9ACTN|nr:hypothetical protein [Planosporangium mesophilum]NJC84600.1 hypothetical protein [Planosporangium mesophilum]GII23909.1 hypothetical protein Pme01_35060 [Planosporangium mesophilum]